MKTSEIMKTGIDTRGGRQSRHRRESDVGLRQRLPAANKVGEFLGIVTMAKKILYGALVEAQETMRAARVCLGEGVLR
jgi:hypothetical protein